MFNYYRLTAGAINTANLAIYQPGFNFTDAKEKFVKASLLRDYINETSYRQLPDMTFESYFKPRYHVICPLNTYFQRFYCYGKPIEKMFIGLFPKESKEGQVTYQLTSKYSSVVDTSLINEFIHSWKSTDPIMDRLLTIAGSESNIELKPDNLVMDSTYQIEVTITNF